ncbi:MAG: hypothetical protein LC135_04125 [Phycisphaerae bacterium]|nr:hypothetical protein [Phycisphaerae bacterium]MCZ2399039.1 hypothetical protein [Phycisphaerae bacterium]NUQ49405.1 hypothetical protein [Phycisphaerae bacterium]
MKLLVHIATFLLTVQSTQAIVVFSQPHNSTGTLYQSSWWEPDDSDYDQWVWDNFTLVANTAITEVTWRGGYIYNGYYTNSVNNFTVAIYPSIAGGSEPDIAHPPLVQHLTGGNAGETLVGTFGGVKMYDYHFTLPSPFQAAAGTKYWVLILAWQHGLPEWGLAAGSGGNGSHFRWYRGAHMYQHVPGDAAFTLMASEAPTYAISASVAPPGAGTVQGAGDYPEDSLATLVATPSAGFGFLNWTENNVVVSTSATYSFVVNANRTLVANFVPAYTVTTTPAPTYAGGTTGDGVFNQGSIVTVTATAKTGFHFVNWTRYGNPVSNLPVYTFTATMDMPLVANFAADFGTVVFDFDNAPVHTPLPIDLTVAGLTAHLSATGSGFSIQHADALGFTPAGFSGLCVYPNSVFPADLLVSYSSKLTYFSIMYAVQELGCDDSATMRVTAYKEGAFAGTATATVPVPGTWPTGTLAIAVPTGFDSVVVHYDSPPPTCQDWGPIFLADNMIVSLAPTCAGDVNSDGRTDQSDLGILLASFGQNVVPGTNGDLNGDGVVNQPDLGILLAAFGCGT